MQNAILGGPVPCTMLYWGSTDRFASIDLTGSRALVHVLDLHDRPVLGTG
jgi:hypothetical protein